MGTSDFSQGVMPNAIKDIFQKRDKILSDISTNVKSIKIELSYLEIYLEDCYDLLSKENISNASAPIPVNPTTALGTTAPPPPPLEKKVLNVRETNGGETYLDGLTTLTINNIQEVAHYLNIANKVRSTGKTAMNNASSRSHAICIITLTLTKSDNSSLVSKLNLVDLAGSERAKKTQATGEVFQEGISINKGLLALGNVVAALSARSTRQQQASGNEKDKQQHIHVPYRESKLTRLLKDSLGGNAYTVLLACLSPAAQNYDESLNTLRFASRASSIVNSAKINLQDQQQQFLQSQQSQKEFQQLKDEMSLLQDKYNALLLQSLEKQHEEDEKGNSSNFSTGQKGINSEQLFNYSCSLSKMNNSLKMLLMYCFSEDLFIEESELQQIAQELEDIRNMFNIDYNRPKLNPMMLLMMEENENHSEEEKKMMQELMMMGDSNAAINLPDIISIIDEIKFLQHYFEDLSQKANSSLVATNTITVGADDAISREFASAESLKVVPSKSKESTVFAAPSLPSKNKINGGKLANTKQMLSIVEQVMQDVNHSNRNSMLSLNSANSRLSDVEEADGILNLSNISRDTHSSSHEQNLSTSSFDLSHDALEKDLGILPTSSVDCQQLEQDIYDHEEKLENMMVLTEQYQSTIQELQKEIRQLEIDKQQIQVKQQKLSTNKPSFMRPTAAFGGSSTHHAGSSGNHIHQQNQLKSELKQKQQLLEEKTKILQKKEKEFQRITQSKESLIKKMEEMNAKLLTYKQTQVNMMKQLHEKEMTAQMKNKEHLKQEQQLQKQLNMKSLNIQSLTNQLTMKERAYQNSLQSKEKEMNWLKELLLTKEKYAQQQRQQLQQASNRNKGPAVGKFGGSTITFQKQFAQLFSQSVDAEKTFIAKRSSLSYSLEKKAKLVKQKQNLESILKEMLTTQKKTRSNLKKQFALQQLIQQTQQKILKQQEQIKSLQQELNKSSKSNETTSMESSSALFRLVEDAMSSVSTNSNVNAGAMASLTSQMKTCFQKLYQQFLFHLQEKERLQLVINDYQQKEENLRLSVQNPDHLEATPAEEEYLAMLFPTEEMKSLEDFYLYYDYSRRVYHSAEMSSISSISYYNDDDEEENEVSGGDIMDEGDQLENDDQQLDDTFYPSDDDDEEFSGKEDSDTDDGSRKKKRRMVDKKKNNNQVAGNAKSKKKRRDSMQSISSDDNWMPSKGNSMDEDEDLLITESESDGGSSDDSPKRKKKPKATLSRKRKAGISNAVEVEEGDKVKEQPAKKPKRNSTLQYLSTLDNNSKEYEEWNKLTVKQLKAELAARNLPVSGKLGL